MRCLLALLLWCWALAVTAGPLAPRSDFQARCEDSIGETLSVLTGTQNGFRIDNSVGFRALTVMKGRATKGRARPGQAVLGLTRTESRVSINVGGRLLVDQASGYECIAPHIEI